MVELGAVILPPSNLLQRSFWLDTVMTPLLYSYTRILEELSGNKPNRSLAGPTELFVEVELIACDMTRHKLFRMAFPQPVALLCAAYSMLGTGGRMEGLPELQR
jgi:hypothetical protein